ncbi:MAG: hypothetical protein OSJ62_04220 [Lachnospiraceae bacterium]|nr:hypothetical protein [Lachnospiraceae bacterium]
MKKTKWILGMASAAAIILVQAAMPVFAVETEVSEETYHYLQGRQRSISRNELYAQADQIEDETERDAFLIANGIADIGYSEEAAASYRYVGGRERGIRYRLFDEFSDFDMESSEISEIKSSYSYVIGQKRGSVYHYEGEE